MQGVMQREWHVYCGGIFGMRCESHASCNGGTQADAKRYFKKTMLWRETKERGWLCPRCSEKWVQSAKDI